MNRFEDKVVLITGAASGIGRATVERIGAEGGRLLCADVADEALAEVVAALPGRAVAQTCDVSVADSCTKAVEVCLEEFGRLDCLINMAGILQMGHTETFPREQWKRVLDVNLSGTFFMCQAALPALLESKGNIVNAASSICFRSTPYAAAYAASKGGVLALSRMLAVEYGRRGLRVNSVAPGAFASDMNPTARDHAEEMGKHMPTGRIGKPGDIAGTCVWLAAAAGDWVCGTNITVDGGWVYAR